MLPDPCSSQSYPFRGETFAPSHHSRGETFTPSHHSRGETFAPLHHSIVRGNKATRIYLPAPRPSLDSAKHLPSSVLFPHLAVDQNNPVSLKDVDDHAIGLPTPRQPLDYSVKQPLSFDSVLSRLTPLLDGTAQMNGERKVTVVGVSSDIVDKLRAKSEASELPGWENLRYVGFSSLVFNKCT